jgi:integrase
MSAVIQGFLIVVDRHEGPVYYGKWRDSRRRQVKRRLGPAWLDADGSGGWRKRRGRCPDGWLEERAAQVALRAAIDDHEKRLVLEARVAPASAGADRTFAAAASSWLDEGLSVREWKWSTYLDYRDTVRRIVRSFGDREVSSLRTDELTRFLAGLRPMRNGQRIDRAPSPRMRTKYTVVLRSVLEHAVDLGWIVDSPAAAIKVRKPKGMGKNHPLRREEYLTPEEVHRVVAAAGEVDETDGALVLTLAFAGLRLGEALALRWEHVDFERSALAVHDSWTRHRLGTPKGGGGRTVPMADEVAQTLARLSQRELLTGPGDLVFLGKRGGYIDANRFRLRYYEAEDRAGIAPRRTLHQLRHTFATVCASHGIPLRTIQGWCGHENYETTERYAHFLPRHEDAALVSAAFGAGAPSAVTAA